MLKQHALDLEAHSAGFSAQTQAPIFNMIIHHNAI